MPLPGRRPLVITMIGAALLGQILLRQSTTAGIVILGLSLAALLVERWCYPVPFQATWLSILLLSLFSYMYIREPLGWFFLAALAIILGTSLRAHLIYRRLQAFYAEAVRRHQAEVAAVAELGGTGHGTPKPTHETTVDLGNLDTAAAGSRPVYWRAVLFGLIAAVVGALGWLIAYRLTGWQVDIVSWLFGMLIGRAVLGGAGDRSSTYLQLYAALLGGLAMLSGHFLVLREALVQRSIPLAHGTTYFEHFTSLLVNAPIKLIGIWGLVFIAVGIFSAWHSAGERG